MLGATATEVSFDSSAAAPAATSIVDTDDIATKDESSQSEPMDLDQSTKDAAFPFASIVEPPNLGGDVIDARCSTSLSGSHGYRRLSEL